MQVRAKSGFLLVRGLTCSIMGQNNSAEADCCSKDLGASDQLARMSAELFIRSLPTSILPLQKGSDRISQWEPGSSLSPGNVEQIINSSSTVLERYVAHSLWKRNI